ncbi:MAG: dATP/dGTP diphosphohydrolase domain-containing protein [Candidatus Nanoarchaeia archaeon]|jgi:hypothetical protein
MVKDYVTKDSGKRQTYKSGMTRDLQGSNKPRFDLILPAYQPYNETLLYRLAMLMTRGAEKYSARNWEKADSIEELDRFKASAWRHFMQFMCGEEDEDHVCGAIFNLNAIISLMYKLNIDIKGHKRKETQH